MSVMITSTCMSFSKARYSAQVRAIFGVERRSIAGSSARFINKTERSIAPVFLKSSMKNWASSKVIPIAANTTANPSSSPKTLACLAIWAATWLCGRPFPENIG